MIKMNLKCPQIFESGFQIRLTEHFLCFHQKRGRNYNWNQQMFMYLLNKVRKPLFKSTVYTLCKIKIFVETR